MSFQATGTPSSGRGRLGPGVVAAQGDEDGRNRGSLGQRRVDQGLGVEVGAGQAVEHQAALRAMPRASRRARAVASASAWVIEAAWRSPPNSWYSIVTVWISATPR